MINKLKTYKLLPRFEGFFEIMKRLDAVKCSLKNDYKLKVSHVHRLLKYFVWENKSFIFFLL